MDLINSCLGGNGLVVECVSCDLGLPHGTSVSDKIIQYNSVLCNIQLLTIKLGEEAGNINVDEILTKVTLLSFEIVPSHNCALLRSAIHVLETLQDVFIWDRVKKPRHVSLDIRNIDNTTNNDNTTYTDNNDGGRWSTPAATHMQRFVSPVFPDIWF
ncbi:hypothetical protein TNCV_5110071 [Trichonephila clavipes]|nr:hypothetical protein TNCV_5110071 [Trichonephila clavipes]